LTAADHEAARATSLLKLQAWLSPGFPTGGFSYSHGLEWAVEAGSVTDAASLETWLRDILDHGSARNDAILIAQAARAVGDPDRLSLVSELALALAPSKERYLETSQQGESFGRTMAEAWGGGEALSPAAFPVAFGIAVGAHGIALRDALPAFLNAYTSNLIAAAIRLGVIGQVDGQRLVAALLPRAAEVALEAEDASLEDLASGALGVDLASILHETQYSRLFRS
jgi:urease accessory protein